MKNMTLSIGPEDRRLENRLPKDYGTFRETKLKDRLQEPAKFLFD
jgi:hypothetical protein